VNEKRKSPRYEHRVTVYVKEKDDYFVTRNLSTKGCFISCPDPFPAGTELNLILNLPGDCNVAVKGIVKHSRPGEGMGVEFTDFGAARRVYLGFLKGLASIRESRAFFEGIREARKENKASKLKETGRKAFSVMEALKSVFMILLMASFFFASLKQHTLEHRRNELIREMEKARGTKVITMIHREETVGFLGIPVKRYIKVEDAEAVLRAIREVPPDKPIDFILHTPGGMLLPAFQIAKALKDHKGKVTVFVPHYAMSGGTLIALAADEIVMDRNAVLGPVDPQFMSGGHVLPAVSVLKIPEHKSWDEMDDSTIVMIDQANKAVRQVEEMVRYLLACKTDGKDGKGVPDPQKIINRLVTGQVTHDYPIFYEEAKRLGLPVSTNMPEIVYKLMDLYPQPSSVGYSGR